MNCPGCGAAMRLDADCEYFRCEFCGRTHLPEPNCDGVRLLGEPSDSMCPICRQPLAHAAVAGVRVLYCISCRGMLIAMHRFMTAVDELRAKARVHGARPHAPDPAQLRRRIQCPECKLAMDTHLYAGPGNIVIDSCSRCQLNWLDRLELDRVASAAEERHSPDA